MTNRPSHVARAAAIRAGRVGAALALQLMPTPRPDHVLFNSFTGRYSDNPRGLYEQLVRRAPGGRHVWVAEPPLDAFPAGAARVKPFGWRHLEAIGHSGLLVSNVQMANNFRKQSRSVYVQTWHGTPLKRIGSDNERWRGNPRGWRSFERDAAQWDYLVSQNPFSTEIFRRAFPFDGEILEAGDPRNDALNAPDRDQTRRRVRARLASRRARPRSSTPRRGATRWRMSTGSSASRWRSTSTRSRARSATATSSCCGCTN